MPDDIFFGPVGDEVKATDPNWEQYVDKPGKLIEIKRPNNS